MKQEEPVCEELSYLEGSNLFVSLCGIRLSVIMITSSAVLPLPPLRQLNQPTSSYSKWIIKPRRGNTTRVLTKLLVIIFLS